VHVICVRQVNTAQRALDGDFPENPLTHFACTLTVRRSFAEELNIPGQLRDKLALVTGAGSGIGKATALLLAEEGAKVAALSRTEREVVRTAKEIAIAGGEAIPVTADISQPEQMQTAIQQIAEEWGRLDIVFANAGIVGVWATLEDLEPDEWDQILDINLKGTFFTVKYAVPLLKVRGGSVIITSSVNGTRMFSNTGATALCRALTAYSASKAGQVAFAKMIALELAQYRIRVNVICPGYIDTEVLDNAEWRGLEGLHPPVIFPEGSIPLTKGEKGKPEQVAQLVLFLASDASDHISGTEIYIDGCESLIQA